jgi:hypothetical protein
VTHVRRLLEDRRWAALAGAALVALGAAAAGVGVALLTGADRGGVAPAAPPAPGGPIVLPAAAAPSPSAARAARRVALPVRIIVPAIGVRARIVQLGLNRDGTLEVPRRPADTGWWRGGARPGARGPAVIAGHVDSKTGPAVFYRLGTLRRGDRVTVVRRDGTSVRFVVRRLLHAPKDRFPTRLVYGPTKAPTLRLITCSGAFDRASGHYVDNTIVFATRPPR